MKTFPFNKVIFFLSAFGILILFISCGGFSFEVKIPKELIIKQVNHKFPTVKSKGLMTVKLSKPVLDFQGSRNRLGVTADAEVKIFGMIPLRGLVICDGTLQYNKKNGAFNYTDIQVKKFSFKEIPESKVDQVSGLVGSAVLSALGGLEVYRLNPDDSQEKLAKLALKGVRITDNGVVAKLGLGD